MKKKILIGLLAMVLVLVIGSMAWMPTASAESCPGCEGSGICDECDGDGINWLLFTCESCDGTGNCPTCDGTGEIITAAEIGICVGIVVIIVIILIAIIVYAVKKKETIVIKETAPYPQQYQQSPSPQTSPCSTCGQSLRYVQAYQRWYCDTCRKYV